METVVEWNARRQEAFMQGRFKCDAPGVCTAQWKREHWLDWVTFDDATLNRIPRMVGS